jgi:hypothetical protein
MKMLVRISCVLFKLSIQISVSLRKATVLALLLLCEDGGMCAVPSFKANFTTLNCFSRRNGFFLWSEIKQRPQNICD